MWESGAQGGVCGGESPWRARIGAGAVRAASFAARRIAAQNEHCMRRREGGDEEQEGEP